MDHQSKSDKVAGSLYQVFKVALSMYQEWMIKEKSCKVVEYLFQVFKVAFSMCHEWITNHKAERLRSLYIKRLKLRCLCIKSGSPWKKW